MTWSTVLGIATFLCLSYSDIAIDVPSSPSFVHLLSDP
jgi:hypothetical protein